MPYNSLVSKIRCLSPNKKSTALRNRNILVYIATREGTDLMPLKDELANSMETDPDAEVYLKYIHERPKSHGLFGNLPDQEISDLTKLSSEIYQISQDQNIYTAIISLDQRDAQALGYYSKDKWNTFLQAAMPDLGDQFKIPNYDLKWVAAYHAEDTHPHAHVMFWSESPKVQSPYIHYTKQNTCRELLSKKVFSEEHQMQSIYKTVSRDSLLEIGKDFIDKEIDVISLHTPGIMPEHRQLSKIPEHQLNNTSREIMQLIAKLPDKGRLKYGFMPKDIKKQIDSITDLLIENKEMKAEYTAYCNHAAGISASYSPTTEKQLQSIDNAKKDIYKRLGNKILDSIKPLVDKKEFFLNSMESISTETTSFTDPTDLTSLPALDDPEFFHEVEPSEITSSTLQLLPDELLFYDAMNDLDFIDTSGFSDYEKEALFELQYEIYLEKHPDALYIPLTSPDAHIKWSPEYKEALSALYDESPNYEKTITLLNNEHQKGNILATHELGKICERGLTQAADSRLAADYYEKAFLGFQSVFYEQEKQNIYAAYRVGKMFEYGQGVEKNRTLAKSWYEKATSNVYAQYSLAKILMAESNETDDYSNNKRIVNLLKNSAEKNSYAAYELGRIYQYGTFAEQDAISSNNQYSVAFKGFSEMLDKSQKNDDLMYRLGKMYQSGLGTNIDLEKARTLFEDAAKLKNVNALYSLSKMYLKSGEQSLIEKAIDMLKELYEINPENHLVLYSLGGVYSDSGSNYYDIRLAVELLQNSADLGNDFALYKLGNLYSCTPGTHPDLPPDLPLAISYLQKSIDMGNDYAMYSLGKIFSDPESPHYDIKAAIDILNRSADKGNDFALYKLGSLYSCSPGTHPDLPPDLPLAISYLQKSIDMGNHYAMYSLGKILSDPESPHYDIKAAIDILQQSADKGNDFALYKLGNLYSCSPGTHPDLPPDLPLAISYLEKSAEMGNHYAMYSLGKLYSDSESKYYDIDKALDYLNKSIENGNSFAMMKLGNMYLWGKGVDQDVELGKYWLNKSMECGNDYAKLSLQAYDSFVLMHTIMSAYKIFNASYSSLLRDNKRNEQTDAASRDKNHKRKKQKKHLTEQQEVGL